MISFGPLKLETELPRLIRASAAQFGNHSYQHLPRYLEWLYQANPAGRGPSDCLVARQDGEIVGCMHRMILPLGGADGPRTLGVLHNHFVSDAVRSGPGVLLLRRALKDVDIGFAPGVQAPLDQVYRRLGFAEHAGFWLIRTLRPVAGGIQMVRSRLGMSKAVRIDAGRLDERVAGVEVTASPNASDLDRLCQAMRDGSPAHAGVEWTPELVRWRYFDPIGPRHLLLRSGETMAVIAVGMRRGLRVGRLLELHGADRAFTQHISRVMQAAGAALGLAFTTDETIAQRLTAQGWRLRENGTFSFRSGTSPLDLGPATTDVGFEAFNTEFR